jgi:hypothetical protein
MTSGVELFGSVERRSGPVPPWKNGKPISIPQDETLYNNKSCLDDAIYQQSYTDKSGIVL